MAARQAGWWCSVVVVAAVGAAACGGRNDADPVLIPGGGVSSGEVARFLNVYVIDAATGDPVTGAFVLVENEEHGLSLTGTTDATGLARFEDRHLRGPQAVTASAPGFANATWLGVNGANVTVPIRDEDKVAPNVETADVRGTITGWDSLPAPAANHLWLAVVGYSLSERLGAPENEIMQPMVVGLPENACVRGLPIDPPCDWHMITRTGDQAHYYLLLDVDTMGTLMQEDDVTTLAGWGILPGLSLSNGAMVTGEILPAPVFDVGQSDVAVGSPPAGLDQAVLIGLVELGDEGLVPFAFSDVSATSTIGLLFPELTAELTGRSYRLVLVSQSSATPDAPPSAFVITAGIADLSGGTEVAPYLEPPSSPRLDSDVFAYGPSAGATMFGAEIRDSLGLVVWTVMELDPAAAGSFVLPVLPDTAGGPSLPFGDLGLAVTAADPEGFDPADFSLDGLLDGAARVANNAATVSR